MAHQEAKIYSSNLSRVALLDAMSNISNINTDFVKASKEFLSNMKGALVLLHNFVVQFNVQPDGSERNELNIGKHIFRS